MVTLETCILVSNLCCSILAYDPPGRTIDLNDKAKQVACEHSKHIEEVSIKHGFEPTLIASLIIVESRFNPKAVSRAPACGLTQVMPKYTGKKSTNYVKYTCKDLKDPETSISVGVKILKRILDKYTKNDITKALCRYNAGWLISCKRGSSYTRKIYKIKKILEAK